MSLISNNIKNIKKQAGFTLLEVMVALVVFSIGLIGLAGMQAASLKYNHSAYLSTQASLLAYELLDQMRANPTSATNYLASFASSGVNNNCLTSTATCTPIQMAQNDVFEWKESITDYLPNGQGKAELINVGGVEVFVVTIQWSDVSAGKGATEGTNSIAIRSEI